MSGIASTPRTDVSVSERHGEVFLATAVLFLVTAALLVIRQSLDKTHVALAYLLVVLVVSSRGGRGLGLAVSVVAFLCFNFFFLPPYYTLTVADPLNWAVLGAFLLTSLVAAQLLARARNEAASARLRANEVARLSALGAETLNAGRAEDALQAIADVIRSTLGALSCEVFVRDENEGLATLAARSGGPTAHSHREIGQPDTVRLVQWVAANGRLAAELHDGSVRVPGTTEGIGAVTGEGLNPRVLVLPLQVRERTVGVLALAADGGMGNLDPAKERFLEALSYYAALGVERLRLVKDADRADALEKADEVKNAVLASVSHDLRTPLTTIKALAHEIGRDGDDRALTIQEEADRLNRFVVDLLDLSGLMGGALRVKPDINAAEDLVGAAIQRVSGTVTDRALIATLDPSEPLLLGRFDFVHSLRILVNLIENALKFAPSGSTVEVQARRAEAFLEFVVADRGPGIPVAEHEMIFGPFHRRDGSADGGRGVGLGLSIARGLAEAQGGAVRYEPRPGGGSLFILSVPSAEVSDLETSPDAPL